MAGEKDNQKTEVQDMLVKREEIVAKVHNLRAEIAKLKAEASRINASLFAAGLSRGEVVYW